MKTRLIIIFFNLLIIIQANSQNTALHFDGIDDYVEIPSRVGNFDFNEDFTISVWIKPALVQLDTKYSDNDFLEKWDLAGGYPFVMRYINQTADPNDQGRIIVRRYDATNAEKNTNSPYIISVVKVNDGKWHNIIFIKESKNLKLFIDGNLVGSTIDNTVASTRNNSSLFIGKRGPDSNYFKGEIDELNIWDYANFNAIKNYKYKIANSYGLLAAYDFDQGIPGQNNDTEYNLFDSFHENDGKLINFALDSAESNFVLNPTVLIDTTVTTISMENPFGIINNKKTVTENEIMIIGSVKSATPIQNVVINNEIAEYLYGSGLFKYKTNLNDGENKIKIVVNDKYGKKTDYEFILNKVSSQNSSITAQLPKIETGKRVALVIGNSNYENATKLKNPLNDAKLMSIELASLGFKVDSLLNGTKNKIRQAIINFKNELAKDKTTTGLFYYAGHGIQDKKSHNYIVPVEAKMDNEEVIEDECYDIERLLANLKEAKNDLNIIILDACRNNPFARSFRGDAGGGLAAKTPPKGIYIAYATEPGNVADDGTGENGLYTEALVKALREPRLKIEDVFKMTKEEVYRTSKEKQLPWDRAFFLGNFYFNVK